MSGKETPDTTVNGREIKASGSLQMVTVMARPGGLIFGGLVPQPDKSFNAPQDGTLMECYEKARIWAEEN